MLDQTYYRKADEIIDHYGRKAASLIPIMQDIQAEYRYLPGELLTCLIPAHSPGPMIIIVQKMWRK